MRGQAPDNLHKMDEAQTKAIQELNSESDFPKKKTDFWDSEHQLSLCHPWLISHTSMRASFFLQVPGSYLLI